MQEMEESMKKKLNPIMILLISLLCFTACGQKQKFSDEEIKTAYVNAHVNTKTDPNMHYKIYSETEISNKSAKINMVTVYDIKVVTASDGSKLFQIDFVISDDDINESFRYYYDGEKYYLVHRGEVTEIDSSEAGENLSVLNLGNLLVFETDALQALKMQVLGANTRIDFKLDQSELSARMIRELDTYAQDFINSETEYLEFTSHILINEQNQIIQNGLYLKYTSVYGEQKYTVTVQYVIEVLDRGDAIVLDFLNENE